MNCRNKNTLINKKIAGIYIFVWKSNCILHETNENMLIAKAEVLWAKAEVLWAKAEVLWAKAEVLRAKAEVLRAKAEVLWAKAEVLWAKAVKCSKIKEMAGMWGAAIRADVDV